MTDWQLIQAYAAGDEDAFATLVRKYYALVYSAACRHVGDAHLAEDVAQCVFLLFARKATKLSSATAIGGWFLRTVRFVARDVARKRRHWPRFEKEEVLNETVVNPSFDPTGPLASLEESLLALPAKEQCCLLAKFYEGKNFKEIALDFDISEDAAQKRVARGLDKMRLFFHRRGYKISATAIPGLISVGFMMSVKGAVVQTGAPMAAAALTGKSVSSGAAAMATEATRMLAWKHWTTAIAKLALVLVLTGTGAGWVWINREPAVPRRAPFQPNDPRLVALGRRWNELMQRAAVVRHQFPQTPNLQDRRLPDLRAENQSLFRDRMQLAFDLRALGSEFSPRLVLPAYVTSGLNELLELSPAQRAYVFDLVQQSLPDGLGETQAEGLLETNKPEVATGVRDKLSTRQQWRFDEICGAKGEFLLINRTSYGRAPGYMAWQDWLGGGGIITPAEAMEAVPPHLW